MNMHVFCPDCKAEYQVSERSNAKLTVKFVCYECKSSWTDSHSKEISEDIENFEEINSNGTSDQFIDDMKNQSQLLNSLALAEINNSFGVQNSDVKLLEPIEKSDVPFNFETSENSEIVTENGPTQNFPDLKRQPKTSKEENANFVEKRNNIPLAQLAADISGNVLTGKYLLLQVDVDVESDDGSEDEEDTVGSDSQSEEEIRVPDVRILLR